MPVHGLTGRDGLRSLAKGAATLREMSRALAARELIRAGGLRKLTSLKKVNHWMESPSIVNPHLDLMERTHTWMSLRLLRGLDLEEFLTGSRHAYVVCSELLQNGEWDALGELVQHDCLSSMEQTFAAPSTPYPYATGGDINILSAVLSSARTSGDNADRAHLDVSFVAMQGVTLHDLQFGDAPLQLPRMQESTWSFEATVCAEDLPAREDGDAEIDWRVTNIEWKVWEMSEAPQP